ncbi:MAG: NYN domain-containing protein [Blastocatellia bacterium]
MYLIDGNNVMGQRVGWHRDKAAAQRRLLNDLARLAWAAKRRITVVFDGAPNESFREGSAFRGVKILYARPGSDADTRIVEMVERERNRKNLTVVTSDNSLAARVRACGVRVMRAGELRRKLDELAAINETTNRTEPKLDEISDWLHYFGIDENE